MIFSPAGRRAARSAYEIRNDRLLFFYMTFWSAAFLLAVPVAASVNGEWGTLFPDLFRILTSPSKLVTDYFEIGSLSAAFLNAGLCGLFCDLLLLVARIDPDARVLAGYFLVVAHCFYGLNLFNMLPPFLGVLVYSFVMRKNFAEEVPSALFATSLGPFIGDFLFRYTLGASYVFGEPRTTVGGVLLAAGFGLLSGFAIPALLPGTAKMHRGYNLYKAGLAIGLLGIFSYAFFYKTLGISEPEVPTRVNEIYEAHGRSYPFFVVLFFVAAFLISIVWGWFLNGKTFRGYKNLFFSTGHDVDFSERYGTSLCFVNFGVYGAAILLYIVAIVLFTDGAGFTGPTVGVIIAALTFGAAGQTARNVWPIMLGYTCLYLVMLAVTSLCGLPAPWSLSTQAYINGLAFATGLCPFAGKYGWKIGAAAGFLDAVICSSTVLMHGGFVLYNGGFSAGLTALILVPILDFYHAKIKHPDEPPSLAPAGEDAPRVKEMTEKTV